MVANNTMGDNEDAPLNDQVIKRTQETLGKIIKAPPLTEKLLSRPPFRFLHDVISNVTKTTGFMKGLHSDADLKSDNVKEKDHKIAFLQKTIDYIVFVLGQSLATNPLKVVAGKEPDKTNEFLQALAEAATKKVDNDVMVKRFLSGDKGEKNANSASATKAPSNKQKSTAPPQSKSKDRPKENGEKSTNSKGPKESKESGRRSPSKRGIEESPERPSDTTNLKFRPKEAGKERGHVRRGPDGDSEGEPADQGGDQAKDPRSKLARPPSARGRQPSGVPGARGSRAIESHDNASGSEQAHVSKPSKLATQPPSDISSKSKVVIQKATKDADSDEEDEFVVREAGPGAVPMGADDSSAAALLGTDADEDQHGALVKKIIDTTKALDAKTGAKTHKLSPADEAALRRQREAVTREMERLCSSVQASARLAAPLARLSELVQEDLDAMNTELNTWRDEHRKAVAQLAQAKNPSNRNNASFSSSQKSSASANNVSAVNEALRGQLRELDSQLAEMADAVAAVRGSCMRNEQRIAHMLSGNSSGSGR